MRRAHSVIHSNIPSLLRAVNPTTQETEPAPGRPHDAAAAIAGSVLLATGVIIFCLAFADLSGGLPFSLPRSWYTNRPLWYLMALVSFGGGWKLLRSGAASTDEGRESRSPRFEKVVLYTRVGCHLCEEMKSTLERYRSFLPDIEEIDIDGDPALAARFTECVPVLEIDGKVRFRGRLNEILLRRLIEAAPPRSAPASSAPSVDSDEV
ncbi:MAG: glutaredoxin family protein [Planctomycetaceae bacterium]